MGNARRNLFRSPVGHPSRPSRSVPSYWPSRRAPPFPLPACRRQDGGAHVGTAAAGHQRELFSFLIARRAAVTSPEAAVTSPEEAVLTSQGEAMTSAKEGWARVTAPVHPRPRHVPLSLCCPDGVLRRVTVTAARHGRPLYRQARSSRWGDVLPYRGDVGSDVTPAEAIKSCEE